MPPKYWVAGRPSYPWTDLTYLLYQHHVSWAYYVMDDWGGFYDHVRPPNVNYFGYGLRVPGLVISAYARKGYIDHQVLSHDAYIKFIEDDFLNGSRLDPKTDGRPDPRTNVAESDPRLGDLIHDFDFTQPPRPPVILTGGMAGPYKPGYTGPR